MTSRTGSEGQITQDSLDVVVGRDDHRPMLGFSDLDPLLRLARYRGYPAAPGEQAEAEGRLQAGDQVEPDVAGQAAEIGEAVESDASGGDHAARAAQETASRGAVDSFLSFLSGRTDQAPEEGPFHTIAAGDLADVDEVYVFVHGWVPGSRTIADLKVAQEGVVARAWDDSVRNRLGRSLVESYEPLLAALHQRNPEAAVLWFSWVDQSATDTALFAARNSLRNTSVNGSRLATALTRAFGENTPKVHLIGHSHGSVVATHAALALNDTPTRLTLLDCPEGWFSRAGGAAGLLDNVLPRLQPGRAPGQVFVDSYVSFFGRFYHDQPGLSQLVDVRLTPVFDRDDPASRSSQAHHYAVNWFGDSVASTAGPGFGWADLLGTEELAELSPSYLVTRERAIALRSPRRAERTETEQLYRVETLPVGSEKLTRDEPDVMVIVQLPPDALMIEFDYEMVRPGRGTALDAGVDRQIVWSAEADVPVPARGRILKVQPQPNAPTLLQFRLRNPGLRTSVTIERLRVVRSDSVSRNLDDKGASATFFLGGAITGVTVSVLGMVALSRLRRLVRRLRDH